MDTTIDPTIKNLVSAIGRAETGDPSQEAYSAKGQSGEFGRYQFMPDTWKQWAPEFGVNVNDTSIEAQNKVAYNKVAQWKAQGLSPAQIASKWNSGDQNAYKTQTPGKNAQGVYYDTPGYTLKVSNYYHQLSGGTTPTTVATPDAPTAPTQTPPPLPKSPDLLQKVGSWVNAIFPGKEVGDLIGSLYDKLTLPPEQAKQVTLPHPLQVLADVAQGALLIGGLPGVAAGGSVAARIGIAGLEGGAFGGLGAVAGGSTDPGEIAKQAGIGATVGAATGGIFEGAGAAIKGLRGLAGKTAEEIAAIPESEVSKLSLRDQQEWYRQQAQVSNETTKNMVNQAKILGEQSVEKVNQEIQSFSQKTGEGLRKAAIDLKEPIPKLFRDVSDEYVALGEGAVENSENLNNKINQADLSYKIDDKFQKDPEIAASLKQDLGLTESDNSPLKIGDTVNVKGTDGTILKENSQIEDIKTHTDGKQYVKVEGSPSYTPIENVSNSNVKDLTVQKILDKARDIMRTEVSKTAKAGGSVYSKTEYEALQKYNFLMETIGENGVDMTKANEFWRKWKPLQKRIISELKPFDLESSGKIPFTKTLRKAESAATTVEQIDNKLDAQNFISQLENRLGIPEGTIGSDVRDAIAGLEKAKLNKTQINQITKDAVSQIKADKVEALKTMSLKKFNNDRIARTRSIIKRVIFTALGLGAVAGSPVGKLALHATGL